MKVEAAVKKICPFMTRHEILDGNAELVVTFCQGPLCMSWEMELSYKDRRSYDTQRNTEEIEEERLDPKREVVDEHGDYISFATPLPPEEHEGYCVQLGEQDG